MEAGGLAPWNLIQPTISLEMPVPSQGHCGFPSFPVVDWFCLFVDIWVLPFPLEDCSVFGNFVITLMHILTNNLISEISSIFTLLLIRMLNYSYLSVVIHLIVLYVWIKANQG
jgi:hypothetical protein